MQSCTSFDFQRTELSPVRYGLGNLPAIIPLCNPALLVPRAAQTSFLVNIRIIMIHLLSGYFLPAGKMPKEKHKK